MTTLNLDQLDTAAETSIGFVYGAWSDFNVDASNEWGGIRFTSLSIPANASVSACVLSVVPYDSGNDEPNHNFYFEETSAPAAWTTGTGTYNLSGRSRTAASVLWNAGNLGYTSGAVYYSPSDLSTPLQEVIDSQGSLTALVILANGNSGVYDLRLGTSRSCKLDITYTSPPTGTVAASIQPLTAALVGVMQPKGTIAATLQPLTAAASGTQTGGSTGTIAATLQPLTSALAGTQKQSGSIASSLQPLTSSASGAMQPEGTVAASIQPLTASASGTSKNVGGVAASLQPLTSALAGEQSQSGTVAASLQPLTASVTGVMQPEGAIAVSIQPLTSALAGTQTQTGTIASSIQPLTAAASGVMQPSGAVASSIQPLTMAASGVIPITGTIAATLAALTAALTGGTVTFMAFHQLGRANASVSRPRAGSAVAPASDGRGAASAAKLRGGSARFDTLRGG